MADDQTSPPVMGATARNDSVYSRNQDADPYEHLINEPVHELTQDDINKLNNEQLEDELEEQCALKKMRKDYVKSKMLKKDSLSTETSILIEQINNCPIVTKTEEQKTEEELTEIEGESSTDNKNPQTSQSAEEDTAESLNTKMLKHFNEHEKLQKDIDLRMKEIKIIDKNIRALNKRIHGSSNQPLSSSTRLTNTVKQRKMGGFHFGYYGSVAWTGGQPKIHWNTLQTSPSVNWNPLPTQMRSASSKAAVAQIKQTEGLFSDKAYKYKARGDLNDFCSRLITHYQKHGMDTVVYCIQPKKLPETMVILFKHYAHFLLKQVKTQDATFSPR